MKKQTLCSRLWNEVYVNIDGGVFSCCHKQPGELGNIYHDSLRDICNGRSIQIMRQESLSGTLGCYRTCSLLRKDFPVAPGGCLTIKYSDLRRLKISFANTCNIHCDMCRRNRTDYTCLDFDTIKKQIDLSPFDTIEIQGGEPLFIDAARRFFDYAASANKKISFLTNGILIDDAWAEKIALHSPFVCVSLNAATKETHELINKGSQWETVLGNIQRVRSARSALHTSVKIIGHMTIVMQNMDEIPLLIKTFETLGFDSINFGYNVHVPSYLKRHPFKARRLSLKIKEAIGNSAVRPQISEHRLKLLRLA